MKIEHVVSEKPFWYIKKQFEEVWQELVQLQQGRHLEISEIDSPTAYRIRTVMNSGGYREKARKLGFRIRTKIIPIADSENGAVLLIGKETR